MITYRKVRDLLEIGDEVYTTDGIKVVPCVIEEIEADSLVTDLDILFYDEHGYTWWLTEKAVII